MVVGVLVVRIGKLVEYEIIVFGYYFFCYLFGIFNFVFFFWCKNDFCFVSLYGLCLFCSSCIWYEQCDFNIKVLGNYCQCNVGIFICGFYQFYVRFQVFLVYGFFNYVISCLVFYVFVWVLFFEFFKDVYVWFVNDVFDFYQRGIVNELEDGRYGLSFILRLFIVLDNDFFDIWVGFVFVKVL